MYTSSKDQKIKIASCPVLVNISIPEIKFTSACSQLKGIIGSDKGMLRIKLFDSIPEVSPNLKMLTYDTSTGEISLCDINPQNFTAANCVIHPKNVFLPDNLQYNISEIKRIITPKVNSGVWIYYTILLKQISDIKQTSHQT